MSQQKKIFYDYYSVWKQRPWEISKKEKGEQSIVNSLQVYLRLKLLIICIFCEQSLPFSPALFYDFMQLLKHS